jgi:hypothetical protein
VSARVDREGRLMAQAAALEPERAALAERDPDEPRRRGATARRPASGSSVPATRASAAAEKIAWSTRAPEAEQRLARPRSRSITRGSPRAAGAPRAAPRCRPPSARRRAPPPAPSSAGERQPAGIVLQPASGIGREQPLARAVDDHRRGRAARAGRARHVADVDAALGEQRQHPRADRVVAEPPPPGRRAAERGDRDRGGRGDTPPDSR